MKRLLVAALVAVVAGCAPPQTETGAAAVVRGIYDVTQQNIGHSVTPIDAIPMTDDLKTLVDEAQAAATARGEPFIEGDLAANCQDCTSLTNLTIGPQAGPEPVPAAQGHTLLEARFKLNGNEDRAVIYDLVETPQGWRVDNILAEGFNLRTEAQSYLSTDTPSIEPPQP
ncbi:MAG: hypothetical protein U1E03_12095 [Hyphomonadaceae bacterium]